MKEEMEDNSATSPASIRLEHISSSEDFLKGNPVPRCMPPCAPYTYRDVSILVLVLTFQPFIPFIPHIQHQQTHLSHLFTFIHSGTNFLLTSIYLYFSFS